MKRELGGALIGAAVALAPLFVYAQTVVPPQLDAATLRTRLAHYHGCPQGGPCRATWQTSMSCSVEGPIWP